MALSTVADALAQYNANLSWHTNQASAELALEAVRYLLVNRAIRKSSQGDQIDYASLESEKTALEKFLGASSPRSFGRSRVNTARFAGRSSIE